ncbi:hypothetical protein D5P88_25295 [Salmonella enterica subsp. enterica]|nr:hypothetical protein [Salmonella enterica subsp. enterica]
MKRVNTSLTKTGILFSLVLLSPAVMAAENLNFNYTRAGALSLEPKLSLQARGCNAVSDPIYIHVNLMNISVPRFRVTLSVSGIPFPKSYTVFTGNTGSNDDPYSDAEMVAPWGADKTGDIAGQMGEYTTVGTEEAVIQYTDPFCFAEPYFYTNPGGDIVPDPLLGIAGLAKAQMKPIFGTDNINWDKYCKSLANSDQPQSGDFYWPNLDSTYGKGFVRFKANLPPPLPPETIRKHLDNPLTSRHYLQSHIFYKDKISTPPNPHTEFQGQPYSKTLTPETRNDLTVTYDLTADAKNGGGYGVSHINSAHFPLRFNTRAISAITLTLQDTSSGKKSVFKWTRTLVAGGSTSIDNILHLTVKPEPGAGLSLSPFPINVADYGNYTTFTDPYSKFYKSDVRGSYFRGTLVTGNSLNAKFKGLPLSIPPDITGDINLVNTDSLTFIIGKLDFNNVEDNNYSVLLFGSPMRFGPIYSSERFAKIADAMQVRNACY